METTLSAQTHAERMGSYRTYEEWKHMLNTEVETHVLRSYRTYEEWKPFSKQRK